MIILPLQTDAPLYYRPLVTMSLIVGLLLLGLLMFFDLSEEQAHIAEALKSIPMLHLSLFSGLYFLISIAFQLPFFWIFGQVVEGKLGAGKYLIVMVLNVCLLAGSAMGLSYLHPPFGEILITRPLIYSLVGMSLIWAPKNEVLMLVGVFFFTMRSIMFEITITTFAIWFILMEVCLTLFAMISFSWSLELMNLLGVMYGALLGTLMLKFQMVDCENWDIFSVTKGKHLKTIADLASNPGNPKPMTEFKTRSTKKKRQRRLKSKPVDSSDSSFGWKIKKVDETPQKKYKTKTISTDRGALLNRIQTQLDAGKPNAAYSEYQEIIRQLPGFRLPAPQLLELSQAMFKAGHFKQVVPLYEEYLEYFPEEASEIRLRLAGIMIEKEQRPAAGLRVLKSIPLNSLSESHDDYRIQLMEQALEMIEAGVIEFEGGGI